MKPHQKGIHHITVNGGDPKKNAQFYVNTLGIKMVKKSVNQDATDTYHFFYSNAQGDPGSDLSFFPWKNVPQGAPGVGQATIVSLVVAPEAQDFWKAYLKNKEIDFQSVNRFGKEALRFRDPDGLQLELVFDEKVKNRDGLEKVSIPSEHSIKGFWGTTLELRDAAPTELILKEILGFEPVDQSGKERLYQTDAQIGGSLIIQESDSRYSPGGRGTVHHVAFRARDEEDQRLMHEKVLDFGLQSSPIVDRYWFHSFYFRSPGGVLFEVATDGPGFTVDEDVDKLGEKLVLAPWLEPQRKIIENQLPALNL